MGSRMSPWILTQPRANPNSVSLSSLSNGTSMATGFPRLVMTTGFLRCETSSITLEQCDLRSLALIFRSLLISKSLWSIHIDPLYQRRRLHQAAHPSPLAVPVTRLRARGGLRAGCLVSVPGVGADRVEVGPRLVAVSGSLRGVLPALVRWGTQGAARGFVGDALAVDPQHLAELLYQRSPGCVRDRSLQHSPPRNGSRLPGRGRRPGRLAYCLADRASVQLPLVPGRCDRRRLAASFQRCRRRRLPVQQASESRRLRGYQLRRARRSGALRASEELSLGARRHVLL